MAELDPYLQEKLRQRARVKKAKTLGDVAASFKVGQRYDPTKPWQDLTRKLGAAQPWATGLSESEQFFFGKEYDARELSRKQAHDRLLKKVDIGIEKARLDQNAQLTQIMIDFKALLEEKDEVEKDLDLYRYGPGGNPATAAAVDKRLEGADGSGAGGGGGPSMDLAEAQGVVDRVDPEVQRVKDYIVQSTLDSEDVYGESDPNAPTGAEVNRIYAEAGIEPGGTPEEKLDKLIDKKARQYKAEADGWFSEPVSGPSPSSQSPGGSPSDLSEVSRAEMVEKLTMAMDQQSEIPGDRAAAIERAASLMGVSATGLIEEMSKSPNDEHQKLASAAAKEMDARKVGSVAASKKYREEIPARRDALGAHASRAGLSEAWDEIAAEEAKYEQYLEETGQTTGLVPQEGGNAESPEEPGKGGAPISERERNFYNIVSETQGYAPEVMGRMLKAIEDYEDLPTAQSLKAQVVGSQQFSDFMKKRNITDRDIAFRLMNREARATRAADRQKSRAEIIRQSREGRISRKDAEEVLGEQVEPSQPQPPEIDTEDPTRFGLTSPKDSQKR